MNLDIVVIVPGLAVAEIDLHHAHAALGQPQGHQAAAPERRGSVARAHRLGFLGDVEDFRRFGPHAERDLGRLYAGLELRIGTGALEREAIQRIQQDAMTLLPLAETVQHNPAHSKRGTTVMAVLLIRPDLCRRLGYRAVGDRQVPN